MSIHGLRDKEAIIRMLNYIKQEMIGFGLQEEASMIDKIIESTEKSSGFIINKKN